MSESDQTRVRSAYGESGQSLLEVALMMPVIILLIGYAVDMGYFFLVAATITSAARNAAQYSVQGYSSPGQVSQAAAGPASVQTSVVAAALADMTSLVNAPSLTTVQVCSASNSMTGNLPNCTSYGPTGASYTPMADPEAPHFVLQRVDVTYTVQPPVPMTFFKVSMLPTLQFHRSVSMRAMQ